MPPAPSTATRKAQRGGVICPRSAVGSPKYSSSWGWPVSKKHTGVVRYQRTAHTHGRWFNEPEVLILDEPLGKLGSLNGTAMQSELVNSARMLVHRQIGGSALVKFVVNILDVYLPLQPSLCRKRPRVWLVGGKWLTRRFRSCEMISMLVMLKEHKLEFSHCLPNGD